MFANWRRIRPNEYRETTARQSPESQQVEILFPAGGTHFRKLTEGLSLAARRSIKNDQASAQFFSNEVQFNTTDTGGNGAVAVTGMGKRNLLPSGLIAQ